MLKPSENVIKTPHRSQYSLVIAVAKRAREIADEAEKNKEILVDKPVDLAVQDFVEGKISLVEPDPADYVERMVSTDNVLFSDDGEMDEEMSEEDAENDDGADERGEDAEEADDTTDAGYSRSYYDGDDGDADTDTDADADDDDGDGD